MRTSWTRSNEMMRRALDAAKKRPEHAQRTEPLSEDDLKAIHNHGAELRAFTEAFDESGQGLHTSEDTTPFVDGARQTSCPHCGHTVTEYERHIGLIPTESRSDGSWANHSSLVCELRQELNALKKERGQ